MAVIKSTLRSLFRFPARLKSYKLFLFIGIILVALFLLLNRQPTSRKVEHQSRPTRTLYSISKETNDIFKTGCLFHSCFDVNVCSIRFDEHIGVYVYDHFEYVSSQTSFVPEISDEYSELLSAIKKSRYYEPDIDKACVFIPSLDTLSQAKMDVQLISIILNSQPR